MRGIYKAACGVPSARSIRPTILRTADHDSRLGLLGLVMPHPGTPEELVMPHLGTPEEPVMPHLTPRGYRARATVSLTAGAAAAPIWGAAHGNADA